jgi:hypothetical protein
MGVVVQVFCLPLSREKRKHGIRWKILFIPEIVYYNLKLMVIDSPVLEEAVVW